MFAWSLRFAVPVLGLLLAAPGPAFADIAAGRKAIAERNFEAAVRELSPLAREGNADAQYLLGTLYANGDGVPQSYEAAGALFEAAAARGQSGAKAALDFLRSTGSLKSKPAAVAAAPAPAASAPSAQPAPPPAQTMAVQAPPATPAVPMRIQLATVQSEDAAKAEARRVARRFQVQLGGIAVVPESFAMADGSTVYRVLSEIVDDARAKEACDKIKADSGSCFLIKP